MPGVTDARRRILIWDAPNVDMTVATILGRKPARAERPDLAALARWFVAEGEPGTTPEAAVFVNVPEHLVDSLGQWVQWLRATGYRVFAKPKDGPSDVDDDMVGYLALAAADGLVEAVVASHDARLFIDPLERLHEHGIRVTLLGFREHAGGLSRSSTLRYVDLEAVPGLFGIRLPRTDLAALPMAGAWLEPLGPLGGAPAAAAPDVEVPV